MNIHVIESSQIWAMSNYDCKIDVSIDYEFALYEQRQIELYIVLRWLWIANEFDDVKMKRTADSRNMMRGGIEKRVDELIA